MKLGLGNRLMTSRLLAGGSGDPIAGIPNLLWRIQSWNPETFLNALAEPATDLEEVVSVVDLSEAGVTTSQATLAKQALWVENVINGHGALWFDDTDDGYLTTCSTGEEYTIYFVANTEVGGGRRTINSNETNKLVSTSRDNNAVYLGAAVVGDLSAHADTWCIGVLRVSTANTLSSFRLNGVDVTANPAIAAEWFTITLGAVGAVAEALAGMFSAGGAFGRVLTLEEVNILETYLAEQTGIELG